MRVCPGLDWDGDCRPHGPRDPRPSYIYIYILLLMLMSEILHHPVASPSHPPLTPPHSMLDAASCDTSDSKFASGHTINIELWGLANGGGPFKGGAIFRSGTVKISPHVALFPARTSSISDCENIKSTLNVRLANRLTFQKWYDISFRSR